MDTKSIFSLPSLGITLIEMQWREMEELTGKCYLTGADGAQHGAIFAEVCVCFFFNQKYIE